jgi:hypothetical protein
MATYLKGWSRNVMDTPSDKILIQFGKIGVITIPAVLIFHYAFGFVLEYLFKAGNYTPSGLISGWPNFHFGEDLFLFPIFSVVIISVVALGRRLIWKKPLDSLQIVLAMFFLLGLWWIFVQSGIIRYLGRALDWPSFIMWWGLQIGQFWLAIFIGALLSLFLMFLDLLKANANKRMEKPTQRNLILGSGFVVAFWIFIGLAKARYASLQQVVFETTLIVVLVAFLVSVGFFIRFLMAHSSSSHTPIK